MLSHRDMTPFFVIGPPKTGTTVLTRLLCQHPDVTSLSESYVLQPDAPPSIANPQGEGKWETHGFTREDAERWQRAFAEGRPADALRAVLEDAWRRMGGGEIPAAAGDSWPYYMPHLPTVLEAFPDAKLIYSTRDPRATYWSGETFRGRRNGVLITSQLLEADRRLKAVPQANDGRTLAVRYEKLVEEPAAVLGRIWEFLGVEPGRGWVDYDAERDPWPGRWTWVSNATRPLDPSRIDRWQQEMPAAARRIVGLASAEYCAAYGYPVELDDSYTVDEMLTAFTCGGSLAHYPPAVEEIVRREILRRSASLQRPAGAAPAQPQPGA